MEKKEEAAQQTERQRHFSVIFNLAYGLLVLYRSSALALHGLEAGTFKPQVLKLAYCRRASRLHIRIAT